MKIYSHDSIPFTRSSLDNQPLTQDFREKKAKVRTKVRTTVFIFSINPVPQALNLEHRQTEF